MKHVRIDPGSPEEQKLLYRCGIGALIFAVLDQITKELVIEHIQMYERVPVIPGFFDLTYVTNPGMGDLLPPRHSVDRYQPHCNGVDADFSPEDL